MAYVDGFLLAVPKRNLRVYRNIARKAGKVWREHGALDYKECVADDVKPGKLTSFPQAVRLKKNESVWSSWIDYRSKAARNRNMKKGMAEQRLAKMMGPKAMPFDMKRMIYGGVKVMVDL